jgi:hypothetical protein
VSGKANPAPIIRGHFATLVDARTGRHRAGDFIVLYAIPAACAGVVAGFDVRISGSLAVGLTTVAGIVGAFLFQLSVQLVDRASTWADTAPAPGPRTARQAQLLRELMANAAYASLTAIAAAVVLVIASVVSNGLAQRVLSVVAALLLAHLALTLVMVLRRVFLMAMDRIDAARTGAARIEAEASRSSSFPDRAA